MVITKARPLTVHLYKEGLARFSTDKYDTSTIKNVYSHLTNTSINKNSHNANSINTGSFGSGIKWTFGQLKALFRVSINNSVFW